MSMIDDYLEPAIEMGYVPGFVAAAADNSGMFYQRAFGQRTINPAEEMSVDSIFRIFSMTKIIGTVAALILLERRIIDLDQPVDEIIPAFGDLQVLVGFDGNVPVVRPPKRKATIRHLATHTSGLTYDIWNANMAEYMEVTGTPGVLSGQKKALDCPLTFDPGEKWDYGIGIDWLGQVVEVASGRRLDHFCKDEIFTPLGMIDTDFECKGEKRGRLVSTYAREDDGTLAPINPTDIDPPSHPEFYGAGAGLYSTAPDFIQFLLMLLKGGTHNGVRILKPQTVELMTQNHIGDLFVRKLVSIYPSFTNDVDFFPGVPQKHGLGGVINLEQQSGMRAAGSLTWAGILNTYYWWDPANKIVATILMQFLPFVDHKAIEIYANFEKAVYASR